MRTVAQLVWGRAQALSGWVRGSPAPSHLGPDKQEKIDPQVLVWTVALDGSCWKLWAFLLLLRDGGAEP